MATGWARRVSRPIAAALRAACAAALLILAVGDARADRDVPPGAVAWWRLDPGRFASVAADDPRRGVVEAALRAAARSGVVSDPDAERIVAGLLAASVVGATPHTLCIFDVGAGERGEGARPPALRFRAALELRTAGDHAPYVRTLEAILAGGARPAPGVQRRLRLPGGRAGVAYREEGWPEWREVSWCSVDGAFIVAIGPGALEEWLAAMDAGEPPNAPPSPWERHRGMVDNDRPPGEIFLETYIDLNGLRLAVPETMAAAPWSELLARLRLSNARSFMLHGRWVEPADVAVRADDAVPAPGGRRGVDEPYRGPPLLVFDGTFSARSEPPGTVRRLALTESFWPAPQLRMPPPPGSYAMVLRADVRGWLDGGLGLYGALLNGGRAERFAAARAEWERRSARSIERVAAAIGPWVVLSDHPRPAVPVPGATTLFAELRPGANRQRFLEDLRLLLTSFTDRVDFDAQRGVWSLRLDEQGWMRVVTWGLASGRERHVLVGGLDPAIGPGRGASVVEANRRWLERAE